MGNNSNEDNAKAGSKFQRSSLRARNKTLMMTPADVSDYQPSRAGSVGDDFDLADIFEDSVAELSPERAAGDKLVGDCDETLTEAVPDALDYEDDALGDMHSHSMDISGSEPSQERIIGSQFASKVADIFSNQSDPPVSASTVSPASVPAGTLSSGRLLFRPPGVASAPQINKRASEAPRKVTPPSISSGPIIMRETREVSSVAGSLSDHGEGASKDYNSYVTPQGAMAESKNGGQPSSDEKVPALIETLGSSLSDEAKAYREEVVWRTKSKLVGFLVSYSSDPSGRYIELREGRLLITRDVTSNDSYLVINDANVSPLHATMRISADGAILVLDQLSEHGTHVLPSDGSEQRTLNGDKGDLFHGDVVVFGKCEYHVVTVGVIPSKQAKA